MTYRRPLTPIGYLFVPLAFLLVRVVRPRFDAIFPEKTKYKCRVIADSSKEGPDDNLS